MTSEIIVNAEESLCWECVSDPVLRQWLRNEGHLGKCTFCGKRRLTCSVPQVAAKIDTVIREFFRPAALTAHIVEYSDNLQYWEDGRSAADIMQGVAGIEPDVADAIDTYLSAAESHDVRDGDDAYYGGAMLEHIDAYAEEFMDTWFVFEERLKHEVRFFDERGKRLLDELFADLPSIAGGKAIVALEPGTNFSSFFRARIANDNSDVRAFITDPGRSLGPPPPHLARGGRMNPPGIPAFYGAFSEEVAIAEIRPPVGSIVAVAKFCLLRPIRLLDMSFLPFAYHEESIFSPNYDRLRNKVRFLEKFHRRISRPVLPTDEELAYLPTSAVAAYISNVMGLDGIIYDSMQIGAASESGQLERSLCNIALFRKAARVEGVLPSRGPVDYLPPPFALVTFGGSPIEATVKRVSTAAVDDTTNASAVTSQEISTESNRAPEVPTPVKTMPDSGETEEAATVKTDGQAKFMRIRSARVEASPLFLYLSEDGYVHAQDGDDD